MDSSDDFKEGERWLHFWAEPRPSEPFLALAVQAETIGCRITAAPYCLVTPSEALSLFDRLARLPGAKRFGDGVSISLDYDSESE